MAAATQTEEEDYVPLKLVLNEERSKVLFAEAGKDFVDVLCSFLTFPLGTIARLVQKESNLEPVTVGCLNKLYQSVADLDKECLTKEIIKEMLLNPNYSLEDYCSTLKLNIDDTEPLKYYMCTSESFASPCDCKEMLTTSTACLDCKFRTTPVVILNKECNNGFVNDGATFIITDDLRVIPNSMDITTFVMLQNLGLKNTSSLKEMTVNVTKEKVLDLLKCSLVSKSTLTYLFLGIKPTLGRVSNNFSCGVEINDDIQITVKLVIRKTDGKILYAQGGHDFADFLISFLTFPLGGVARMFGGNFALGCIDVLYNSITTLDENMYFLTQEAKNRIVDPHLAPHFGLSKQILPICQARSWFYCHDDYYITCKSTYVSNFFGESMDRKTVWVESIVNNYVKGPRTYIVTDDLVVTECSPTSVLRLINHFETPLKDLKEKVINIGANECLSILKASLTSTSALTNGLGHLVV
ncbi:uncharacterized protein LOC131637459 [Vicia villosa]|uniref:uncharacterized protein LOC131637459 n=1 Tax=Vicia villosa TaxID=3911 RepID=UPI00273C68A6|nr:uncharacterized protein LOC131637459 [Vicia villosa]